MNQSSTVLACHFARALSAACYSADISLSLTYIQTEIGPCSLNSLLCRCELLYQIKSTTLLTKKFDFYPVRHFFANFLQSFTLDFSIVPVYLVVKSWSCYQFDNVVPILINHPAFFPIFIHLFTFFPVLLEAYFFSFFSKNLKLPEMEFFLLLLKILPDPNRQSQISFR